MPDVLGLGLHLCANVCASCLTLLLSSFSHQPCSGAWEAASCGKMEDQVTATGQARKYGNAFSTRTLVM